MDDPLNIMNVSSDVAPPEGPIPEVLSSHLIDSVDLEAIPQPPPIQKPKKQKKVRDPNAPKKPLSSYFLFHTERHRKWVEDNPGQKADFKYLAAIISDEWKQLPPEQKEVYTKRAALSRAEYSIAYEKYKKEHLGIQTAAVGKIVKTKIKKPKGVLSAYMFFCKDKRETVIAENAELRGNENFGKVGRYLGSLWKMLSAEDRKIYEEMNEKDRKRYNAELEELNKSSI